MLQAKLEQFEETPSLFTKMKGLIVKHFSFLIMLASSVLYFLFNLWLKSVFTDEGYGEYGLLNGFINIATSFAVIGGDQLLMRTVHFDDSLTVSRKVLRFNYLLLVIFTVVASALFVYYFKSSANIWLVVICSFLSGLTMLTFSVFRMTHLFSAAQLQKNLWRLFALVLCAVWFFMLRKDLTLNFILATIDAGLLATLFFAIAPLKRLSVIVENKEKLDYRLWFGFSIAMTLMALMTNADRFMIDKYVGRSQVGDYFFLQNFFLFPLSLVQTYSGFREITVFKKQFSVKKLNDSLKNNFVIAIALSLLLVVGYIAFAYMFPKYRGALTTQHIIIISLLLLNGIMRVVYSVLSAAMGAIGNSQVIRLTNIYTLLSYAVLYSGFYFFTGFTIITISLLFFIFWAVRAIFFYKHLVKL